MIAVLLVVHLFIAITLVAVVLLQRSEGGGLGIGGGGTMGGLMTTRGSANLLTRVTAVLAACFMATSILLAILSGSTQPKRSIMDQPVQQNAPIQPAKPAPPSVPLAR